MYPSTPVERTCSELSVERAGDASVDTASLSSATAPSPRVVRQATDTSTTTRAAAAAATTTTTTTVAPLRPPTPSLVFTTQFASTPYQSDALVSSFVGGAPASGGSGGGGGGAHPLQVANYNAVVMSSSVVSNNGRRHSVSQLAFEDSPIKVTCRTRGRSHSPYLAPVQAADVPADLDATTLTTPTTTTAAVAAVASQTTMAAGVLPYGGGFSYSGRSSPVQAMAPNFDAMPLSMAGCMPPQAQQPQQQYYSDTYHHVDGNMAATMTTLHGGSCSSGAATPTSHTPVGGFADEAAALHYHTQHAYYSTPTTNNNNNNGSNVCDEQAMAMTASVSSAVAGCSGGDGGGVGGVYSVVSYGGGADVCGAAAYSGERGSYAHSPLLEQTLPATVVHRSLHGRCRFVAFPANLPSVRCRNSRDAPHESSTAAGDGSLAMADATCDHHHNNSSASATTTATATMTGAADSSNNSSGSSAATAAAPGVASSGDKHALFIGQVRFETTPAELLWLVHRTTGACASHLESRGAGCYLLFCNSAADLQLVRTLHKRVLFDIGGVWFARTAEEVDALCEYVALDAALLSRKARLPRDSMVVEELKDGATSSRRAHAAHGGHTQRHRHASQQPQPSYGASSSSQPPSHSYYNSGGGSSSNNNNDGNDSSGSRPHHTRSVSGGGSGTDACSTREPQEQPPPPYYYAAQ